MQNCLNENYTIVFKYTVATEYASGIFQCVNMCLYIQGGVPTYHTYDYVLCKLHEWTRSGNLGNACFQYELRAKWADCKT